jgi:hypothetical protein
MAIAGGSPGVRETPFHRDRVFDSANAPTVSLRAGSFSTLVLMPEMASTITCDFHPVVGVGVARAATKGHREVARRSDAASPFDVANMCVVDASGEQNLKPFVLHENASPGALEWRIRIRSPRATSDRRPGLPGRALWAQRK